MNKGPTDPKGVKASLPKAEDAGASLQMDKLRLEEELRQKSACLSFLEKKVAEQADIIGKRIDGSIFRSLQKLHVKISDQLTAKDKEITAKDKERSQLNSKNSLLASQLDKARAQLATEKARSVEIASRLSKATSQLTRAKIQLDSRSFKIAQAIALAIGEPGKNTLALPGRLFKSIFSRPPRPDPTIHEQTPPPTAAGPPDQTAKPAPTGPDSEKAAPAAPPPPVEKPTPVRRAKAHLNPSVLFMPINGAGLGHLTMTMAVARHFHLLEPAYEIVFFTTSTALPILRRQGFFGYHHPPYNDVPDIIDLTKWNQLFYHQLAQVLEAHRPEAMVFDGTSPYWCQQKALDEWPDIKRIWIKRELYRSEAITEKVRPFIDWFDRVIIPGELGQSEAAADPRLLVTPPIVYNDRDELLARPVARKKLGLHPDKPVAYLQLGAGNINDTQSLFQQVAGELQKTADLQLVVAEPLIANRSVDLPFACTILRDFPNALYYQAFDFIVSAAGYNSVYESLYFGLPTIFFPNMETVSDDQYARARLAADKGAGFVMKEFEAARFREYVKLLLDAEQNRLMRKKAENLFENGAAKAAEYVAEILR